MGQARAIARRALAESRIRDGCFGLFFLLFAYANPVGYRHTYPTLAERVAFARSFGTNKAVELFYGAPHDLLSVGGFTAWRFGGFTAIIAGIWGLLAAVRALRGTAHLAAPVGASRSPVRNHAARRAARTDRRK